MLTLRRALQAEVCRPEQLGYSLLHDIGFVSGLPCIDVTMSMVKVKVDCRVSDVTSADARVYQSISKLMALRAVAHSFIEPADSYRIGSPTE